MREASIVVRWTFEGWHRWPDAPEARDYLASQHRHLFHGEVTLPVTHDDREVEFHDLRDVCVEATAALGSKLGARSCEMIADEVAAAVHASYPGRSMTVSIFEDGENGAVVSYSPEVAP